MIVCAGGGVGTTTTSAALSLALARPGKRVLVVSLDPARRFAKHAIETVVIDTAPSRNAMDFITYPKRLSNLLGGRTIAWMAGLGNGAARGGRMGRVERLLIWAIGLVVSDVSQFFGELARVRKQFVKINEQASGLLLDPRTHYFLVAAPTTAARDDAQYLAKRLKALRVLPRALILNSAFVPEVEVREPKDIFIALSQELNVAQLMPAGDGVLMQAQ